MKQANNDQEKFEKVYQEHEDLNAAVDKIITNEEIFKPPHNLPDVQKVMDDTAFGLLNDQKNLQREKELIKFRANNKQVSLFLFRQGRQSTWMPDKTSYKGFDNLMKRTSRPIVIKSEREPEFIDLTGPDQGFCPHTALFQEQF